jgi:outer membrane protein TolC
MPTSTPSKPTSADVLDVGRIAQAPLPVRLAWLQAVSKQAQWAYAKQVHASAQAAGELARRMRSVGNFTRLQQANQHAMYAETASLLLASSQEALEAREALIRTLGWHDAKARTLVLPEKLPDLPATPTAETALNQVVRPSSTAVFAPEEPSELRSSYSTYRHAYDMAKHYRDEVLPLRQIIAEEAGLRYNGMFIGVFELLAENREHIKAVMASITAIEAFWKADAAFQDMLQNQIRMSATYTFAD